MDHKFLEQAVDCIDFTALDYMPPFELASSIDYNAYGEGTYACHYAYSLFLWSRIGLISSNVTGSITVVDFRSLVSGVITSKQWLSASAIAIGFDSGHVLIFDVVLDSLVETHFHNSPVRALRVVSEQPNDVSGIFLWILYSDGCVIAVSAP